MPLNSKDIGSALERFQYLNEVSFGTLARVLPDVATITMKILYNKFEITRSRDHDPMNSTGTSVQISLFILFSLYIFQKLDERQNTMSNVFIFVITWCHFVITMCLFPFCTIFREFVTTLLTIVSASARDS